MNEGAFDVIKASSGVGFILFCIKKKSTGAVMKAPSYKSERTLCD